MYSPEFRINSKKMENYPTLTFVQFMKRDLITKKAKKSSHKIKANSNRITFYIKNATGLDIGFKGNIFIRNQKEERRITGLLGPYKCNFILEALNTTKRKLTHNDLRYFITEIEMSYSQIKNIRFDNPKNITLKIIGKKLKIGTYHNRITNEVGRCAGNYVQYLPNKKVKTFKNLSDEIHLNLNLRFYTL